MSHRLTVRVEDDDYEKIEHWARKTDRSVSEFMSEAALFRINFLLSDYPLAPLEVQRLNQLVDIITGLSQNVRNVEQIVVSGFDSLLRLTKGDNYLLDEDGSDIG